MLISGSFEKMSPSDRADFILALCKSLGLNPATSPVEFIKLSGKLVLYAKKDCTDQLRKLHGVSVEKVEQSTENDLHSVTVYVRDATGRTDCDIGVVNVKGLSGESLANARMKACSKAKRRATLSIAGLGFLDESEMDTIADKIQPATFVEEAPKTVNYKKEKAFYQKPGSATLATLQSYSDNMHIASLQAIAACKSIDDMTRLGLEISCAGLEGEELVEVKQAYRDRMAALKAAT
jgi:hypothetical protein